MNVASFLENHITRLGEVPSLIFEEKEYTNTWIKENGNRLANGLKDLGVKKGDRVVVCLMNSPEVLVTFQAIFRIGAVIVPIMFSMTPEETEFILSDCKPDVLIIANDFQDKIQMALENTETRHIIILGGSPDGPRIASYEKIIKESPDSQVMEEMNKEDLALLIYTAGTTGRPKGVMLSHGNLNHHANATYNLWSNERPRRMLSCLPMAHMFGVTAMLIDQLNVVPGSVFVLMSWFNPDEIFRLIEKYKISGMGGVPTMFWLLLNHPALDKHDLSSMERVVAGAAPVPEELFKQFQEKVDIEMIEAYGMSESCSAVTCTRQGMARKPGSAGTAVDGAEIKIFDEESRELPPGEPGEIVISGPMVMKGYYNRPEETANALQGKWLYTGDIGYMDEDGYLFITDRKKDMIIKGGENIFPSEIENILLGHPDVLEAAVIGIKDEKYGEEVAVFVVRQPGSEITEDEIINHCHENYTRFKCPSQVKFIDALPKSLVGKILKRDLRSLI